MSSASPRMGTRTAPLTGAAATIERVRLSVVPRRRRRAPRIPFVTLVGLILLGGVVGLLLFNTSMQQSSFATTALETQATNLTAREQTLRVELDELRDPQRVAERAVDLGMVLPPSSAILHLPSGRIEGEPTAATPEDGVRIAPTRPIKPKALAPDPIRVTAKPATRTPQNDNQNNPARDTAASNAQAGTRNGRTSTEAGQNRRADAEQNTNTTNRNDQQRPASQTPNRNR
ncbi:hypothetical protein GCM10027020_00230 [Nocardioides salsibiostraticola]